MPINMSHCRFENTLIALRECSDALASNDDDPLKGLSEEEQAAAKKLIRLCLLLADDYYDDFQHERPTS